MIKKLIAIVSLLFIVYSLSAQDKAKVLVTNSEQNSILVKWYAKHIYTETPVNIYRQEKGSAEWEKINQQPVERGNEVPQHLKEKDQLFNVLENRILGTRAKDTDGLTKLVIMIKSVEYPEFADFLGIQFNDTKIMQGKEYRYKIMEEESELGTSGWITAGQYEPSDPPENFEAKQQGEAVNFSWSPQNNQFLGYHIYKTNGNSEKEKIDEVPVIPSVNEDGSYPDVLFTDDSLKIGETYSYSIIGIDYFGRESRLSGPIKITIQDVTPPPPPNQVITDVSGKTINLYWENENVPDLVGYHIYRAYNKDTLFQRINTSLIAKDYHSYIDTAENIGFYNYKISTVDESGNESYSARYTAEVKDIFPPQKPQMVVASADTGKITLSWEENTEPDLWGYLVYRTIDENKKDYSLLNAKPIASPRFTDKLPKEAKNKFLYRVVAVDSSYNKSAYSDFAATRLPDIIPPQKPQIKTIAQENGVLIIEWFRVFDQDLAGYNVYRVEKDQSPQKLNIRLIKGIELFTDRTAAPNVPYQYFVTATDSSGNVSEESDKYSATLNIKPGFTVEFNRVALNHKKRKELVEIKWNVKSEQVIKGYIIYRKTSDENIFKPVTGLLKETEYEDKEIKSGNEYQYQIRVFSEDNDMIKSAIKKVKI